MATVVWDSGRLKTLTIANAGTITDILNLWGLRSHRITNILIISPAALTGTVTVEVAELDSDTFVALQSGGSDVTLPAGKATQITGLTAGVLRLVSGSSEGAERTFRLLGGASA